MSLWSHMAQTETKPSKYKNEIAWRESETDKTKLNQYPNLSYSTGATLVHEIGHALGLSHADASGKYKMNGIDHLIVVLI